MANNLPTNLQNVDPGFRLGDIKGLADSIADGSGQSSTNGITASTTQTQAGGTVLRSTINRITSANASDAVTLGFQAVPGREVTIINDSGQTIQLFPYSGDKLNDAAANASVSIADNTISRYVSPLAGLWFGGAVTLET